MRVKITEVGIISFAAIAISLCLYAIEPEERLLHFANTAMTGYFAFKKTDSNKDDDEPLP